MIDAAKNMCMIIENDYNQWLIVTHEIYMSRRRHTYGQTVSRVLFTIDIF